jgi:putative flippase GtrA
MPGTFPSPSLGKRFLRYSGVSVVAMALAQAGLAVGYGVLGWAVFASVMLSLVVSIVPSYLLNKWLVWPRSTGGISAARQAGIFLAIALVGSLTTYLVVALAVRIAHAMTSDHLMLSLVVNAAAVIATAAVWLARFWLLDTVVFGPSISAIPGGSPKMASAQ